MSASAMIDSVRRQFASAPTCAAAAYVFGSVARGDDTPHSDLDVAVLLDHSARSALPDEALLEVVTSLERTTGRRVDLAILNDASPDFIHRVLRDGVLVHERDASARVVFEVDARNAYFDLLPMLRAYRRAVIHSA